MLKLGSSENQIIKKKIRKRILLNDSPENNYGSV